MREVTPKNSQLLFSCGGGTNFAGAFDKIYEVLRSQRVRNYSRAVVCFLTDGMATTVTATLLTKLRQMVQDKNSWPKPLTIHSIGFGVNCDKAFLEEVRVSGTEEGMFRYAEPTENVDILSGKIMELFDLIASKSGVELKVNDSPVNLAIGGDGCGYWEKWVGENHFKELKISIPGRNDQIVPVDLIEEKDLFPRWYSRFIDQINVEIFSNSEQIFAIGDEIVVTRPFSGSSLWRMVTRDMKKKTGTVNIFRGGKFLGGRNSEIIILPGNFKVTSWYHYDPICLSQPNIRSHTFKIKDTDSIKYIVAILERQ